jgi:L-fuculose-phosphate aldolase
MANTSEHDLRREIVGAVARLEAIGYNHGSSGNVSCRLGERVLITPTGANSANLTSGKLVVFDLEGGVEGDGVPSSEWQMHAAIFKARSAAQAVVHTHADACVALSCLREALPPFHYMIAGFGGNDVRCARYEAFGSKALAMAAVEALEGRSACLLANHGMIATAASLARAMWLAVEVEALARQYFNTLLIGGPIILPPEEIARVIGKLAGYGLRSKQPRDGAG